MVFTIVRAARFWKESRELETSQPTSLLVTARKSSSTAQSINCMAIIGIVDKRTMPNNVDIVVDSIRKSVNVPLEINHVNYVENQDILSEYVEANKS